MSKTPSIMVVLGTRPEAVKLAPVIRAFRAQPDFATRVCVTAQHREMLDQCLAFFDLRPDFDLNLMTPEQTLPSLASRAISACARVFEAEQPDMVFVQGDTTSAFAAALAASLCKIPVAHVEAGLRSHRRDAPFPEEINRSLIARVADLHFAPGPIAVANLAHEGIAEGVHAVGNTVVDALRLALNALGENDIAQRTRFPFGGAGAARMMLVTLHRRESLGAPLGEICGAIRDLTALEPATEIVFPVHRNPRVRDHVYKALSGVPNVHLLEPLDYPDFIWTLSRASAVLSDSGGVLEEAETLGLPVLIAREVTEREEALAAGNARLVGADRARIVAEARAALETPPPPPRGALRTTFGDGRSAERIVEIVRKHFAAL